MTSYSAQSESVHILDKLHWCHGNVHIAQLWVQLAYGHANLGWTSSAHRCGKYTVNVKFMVFLVFFLPGIYGE